METIRFVLPGPKPYPGMQREGFGRAPPDQRRGRKHGWDSWLEINICEAEELGKIGLLTGEI
jgi:hypothetical protein